MTIKQRKIVVEIVESKTKIDLSAIALAISQKIKNEGVKSNDGRPKIP